MRPEEKLPLPRPFDVLDDDPVLMRVLGVDELIPLLLLTELLLFEPLEKLPLLLPL